MKIKFITAEETLPLRSLQLRNGQGFDYCQFDSDKLEGTIHLAQIHEEEALCVVSLHPQNHEKLNGIGFQLRGMATHPHYLRQGLGKELIEFSVMDLRSKGVNYIWCNSRENAHSFYEKLGFIYLSAEFEVSGLGAHRQMYLLLS